MKKIGCGVVLVVICILIKLLLILGKEASQYEYGSQQYTKPKTKQK